jgi:glycosyl transferase family 25
MLDPFCHRAGGSRYIFTLANNMTTVVTSQASGLINETFPYQTCINLDRRPKRWQQMQRKFAQHGILSVRRVPALDGDSLALPADWVHTPGAYGCLRSHLQAVCEAQRLNEPSILIFEDDVVFAEEFELKFAAGIHELPPDWDMLFFGALHRDEPIRITDHIARITRAYSTYAYVIRNTMFDEFIELNRHSKQELDNNTMLLQQRFNCYCFMPHLTWVETDYSDAQQRLVDHWYLRESLVLFGPQVDSLLGETTIVFAYHGDSAAATENLIYLVHYYHKFFSPPMATVVVEQGAEPTLNPAMLTGNCQYVFLRADGPLDRERCFRAGIAESDPGRKFLILSDDDIYLETLDIRANLRMCEQFDSVTGFSEIVELTDEESLRLRNTKTTRGIAITKNDAAANKRSGVCQFLKRAAIQSAGESSQADPEQLSRLLASTGSAQLRVFKSPNHALRLPRA